MDKDLLLRVKNDDYNAFRQLFDKYYKSLFNVLYYKTMDSDLSDELAQETFVKVWLSRKIIKPRKSFFSYICIISGNLLKDYYRHLNVRKKYLDNILVQKPSVLENPEDSLAYKEFQQAIQTIVNTKLAEKCRQIFILSRFDGKSNDEICTLLNISKKTVENQLYTALKIIRKYLKPNSKM